LTGPSWQEESDSWLLPLAHLPVKALQHLSNQLMRHLASIMDIIALASLASCILLGPGNLWVFLESVGFQLREMRNFQHCFSICFLGQDTHA
jgi:hypothetical protein